MKAIIHPPVHESYKRYRKQLVSQIILPMVLAALLFVGMIVLITVFGLPIALSAARFYQRRQT